MTTVMPGARLARAYAIEAKYETIRMLRTPAFAFPTLILPIGLYLLLGVAIFRNIPDPRATVALFTGFATFAVMGPGMFGFGSALAQERQRGVLTLKRALPMPPAAYLLAKMLMAILFASIVMISMTVIAYSAGRLPGVAVSQILPVILVEILGAVPFCALGLLLGTLASGAGAPAVVNLVYFPMVYLSGMFFPLPPSLQKIAPMWPAYHLNRLVLMTAGTIQGNAMLHASVLIGVTVVCTGLAVRRLVRAG